MLEFVYEHVWSAYMGTCVSVLCMCWFSFSLCIGWELQWFEHHLCDPNLVIGDSDLCSSWTDTIVIRRPMHKIIRRFVAVCAGKIRLRFGSKIASFHVSVCFCLISLFTIVNRYLCFTCIIYYDHLIYFISMITHIISCDISECSLYLYSWFECLSTSFDVIVGCHYWFRTSLGLSSIVTWFDLLISRPSSYLRIDDIFYMEYLSIIVWWLFLSKLI